MTCAARVLVRAAWLLLAACASDDGGLSGPSELTPSGAQGTSANGGVQGNEAMGSSMTEQVIPALSAGRYVFRFGEHELIVDPARGGRVLAFGLQGQNVLTGPEVVRAGDAAMQNNFGSTFWTSPQSDWGWPPESALDTAPYLASVAGNVLTLASDPGEKMGYAVTKRISADAARGRVSLEYALRNVSATKPAAPWEISRVAKRGLVFFPSASAAEPSTLGSERIGGVAWVDIGSAPAGDSKLFQDGSEGWLAYVDGDQVLIKTFEDVPRAEQAPGESEVEVFVSGDFGYVEIEQQGRFATLAPGAASSWRVDWYLRRRPPELEARVGNADLVRWAREQIAR
jgi:hypothetical protein